MVDTKKKVDSKEDSLESIGLEDEGKKSKTKSKKKNVYDNDIRNAELVIDAHSNDPFEVMRIQTYDDAPMAREGDDIVIRVEVSTQLNSNETKPN